MRKLLDWIADRLGYQRKWKAVPWPSTPIPQELLDDDIVWSKMWEEAVASTFDYQGGET
jgi:hypothetical protein